MSRIDRSRKRGRLVVLAGSAVAALGFFAVVAAAPPPGSVASAANSSVEAQQIGNPYDDGGFSQSGYSQPQFVQQPRFRSRGS